jgi:hypothetical protein
LLLSGEEKPEAAKTAVETSIHKSL